MMDKKDNLLQVNPPYVPTLTDHLVPDVGDVRVLELLVNFIQQLPINCIFCEGPVDVLGLVMAQTHQPTIGPVVLIVKYHLGKKP